STWSVSGDAVIREPFFSVSLFLSAYHHDQNSTRKVRDKRRVIRSMMRRWPQQILAMPVMPGLRRPSPLSISVVTRIVLADFAALPRGLPPKPAFDAEVEAEPVVPCMVVAMRVTFPGKRRSG